MRGQFVLYDEDRREVYRLRADAAAIWPLLDGSASSGRLAEQLAASAGWTPERAQQHLDDLLQPLVDAGLVRAHG